MPAAAMICWSLYFRWFFIIRDTLLPLATPPFYVADDAAAASAPLPTYAMLF